ncbi:MAG: hypothetical protein SFT94_01370 [Pseudanabaenaceae cyanobacterium bins.68]|nr:hypothetical protein [Pseudanabaenaceae cyanobacterium bins.68]
MLRTNFKKIPSSRQSSDRAIGLPGGLQCLIPKPSAWVQLWQPMSDCAEAWLMCEYDNGSWAAWIPDLGEVTLTCEQFCRLS